MLKIDVHTHLLPPEIPKFKQKFGYGGFMELHHDHQNCRAKMIKDDGQFFREIKSNCWSPEVRLKECDDHGIDVQVLSTIPVMFSYWTKPQDGLEISKWLNDHVADTVRKNPKRFIGLGTVPLQDPELAIKELERCKTQLGLCGVEIGSHINQWNLNAKELLPFYEAAEKLGMAIFIHPWDMMGKEKMPDYWLPWLVGMPAESSLALCSLIFGGVFEKFPKLRFLIAHGGGSFAFTLGRIEHGFKVRPDLCAKDNQKSPRDYLGKFWVDSLVHDAHALDFLIDVVGSKRVALGSDYPFPLGELSPGELIGKMKHFSEKQREDLLANNALEWLALDKKLFL